MISSEKLEDSIEKYVNLVKVDQLDQDMKHAILKANWHAHKNGFSAPGSVELLEKLSKITKLGQIKIVNNDRLHVISYDSEFLNEKDTESVKIYIFDAISNKIIDQDKKRIFEFKLEKKFTDKIVLTLDAIAKKERASSEKIRLSVGQNSASLRIKKGKKT